MATTTPLAGLRVLELAGWNGVLAGRMLADAGADVVRVIPPQGDPLDTEPPFLNNSSISAQALWYNAGKRIVMLDLASAPGRGRFLQLLAASDILIEDWSPARSPLTEAEITATHPALVRISVTPVGSDGPWAGLKVNDLIANALSGAASVTGTADTPPITGYGNQTYNTVGMYVAIVALAALRAARTTGAPQRVDLSAHEALVSCTEQVLMQWFFPGTWTTRVAERQGALHWTKAYDVFPDQNGNGLMVTAALRLMEVIIPWMIEDGAAQELGDKEQYPSVVALVRNLPRVMQVMREWVGSRDAEALFYEAQRRHQPYGVVWDVPTALKSPQIEARGYFKEQNVPAFGPVPFPGRFLTSDADGPHPAPATRIEVKDLGWDERFPGSAEGGEATSRAPLAGVRILDFTHVLAGPFGTRVLGDLGADVIKVGTAARSGGANSPAHPYYTSWNRNKRSLTLNMGTENGRNLARRLATNVDVVIENFSAGVLSRWGLDRPALAPTNPGVTVISMGGMGQTGPWKDFVTFAPTIHALVGLTDLTNPPGEHLFGYGFSLTDHLSGLAGAFAALQGLEHRRRTGQGLAVDLSQYELGLGLMAPTYLDYLVNGTVPTAVGNRHAFSAWAPHGIYRCTGDDRWAAIAVRGDAEWAALCRAMGREDLVTDPRFATHMARVQNQDALDAAIEDWTKTLDRYEVMARCQAAGIAAGAVQDGQDLVTGDPQLKHREFFTTVAGDTWGEYGIDRFPARFNGQRPSQYEGVHAVGQDTFDILSGVLGLSDDEVAELMANGALS